MLDAHSINPATMCWAPGMDQWRHLADILPTAGPVPQEDKLTSLEGFSLPRFFSDVFKHHDSKEITDLFCCGAEKTTPALEDVQTGWPSPWIFARMLLLCLILYLGFNWACTEYQNPKLIPGLMFVGNFGIPFCVVVLFFELNVRRDVPFSKASYAMVLGGLISLILTHMIGRNIAFGPEAYWAGPMEEPAKLLAAILIASQFRNGRILTGLLLGCAVGAGYAAFESAGYTFEAFFKCNTALVAEHYGDNETVSNIIKEEGSIEGISPDYVMAQRALFTPFMHVIWTTITAGAYWYVQKLKVEAGQRPADDRSIDLSILYDFRFLRIALIPVGLHMVWNSNLFAESTTAKYIVLGIIGWVVALRLVQAGLKQVQTEQLKIKL